MKAWLLVYVAQVFTVFAVFAAGPSDKEMPKEGLRLWLKAGEGITQQSEGKVSRWADQSGKGNHVVQANVKAQPDLVSHSLNGYPVLRFDGAEPEEDFLQGNIGPLQAPITVFAVAKFNNPSQTFGTDFADYIWNIGEGCTNNLSFARVSGNPKTLKNIYLSLYGLDCSHEGHLLGNPLEARKFQVSSAVYRSDLSHTFYINGRIHSFLLKLPGKVQLNGFVTLGRFNHKEYRNALHGEIGEIMIYNSDLSDPDRQRVEDYLLDKFGIRAEREKP